MNRRDFMGVALASASVAALPVGRDRLITTKDRISNWVYPMGENGQPLGLVQKVWLDRGVGEQVIFTANEKGEWPDGPFRTRIIPVNGLAIAEDAPEWAKREFEELWS